MADSRLFRLLMDGRKIEAGHVRLPDLVAKLQHLVHIIRSADQLIAGYNATAMRVVGLSHSSPAAVSVELTPTDVKRDFSSRVGALIGQHFTAVSRAESTESLKPELLYEIRELLRAGSQSIETSSIAFDGASIMLDSRFGANVELLLHPDYTCWGSIEGMLEQVNVHKGANRFRVYPLVGPKWVACHFPEALLADIGNHLARFVSVRGQMKYRADRPYPFAMEVDELISMPDIKDTASLTDLRGRLSQEQFAGMSSETWVRKQREDWDA